MAILRVFSYLLARPSSFAALSRPAKEPSFLSSLTRSAYRRVLRVCSLQDSAGEILAIIVVLELPTKESLRTYVNFEPRNGVCFLSRSNARMHSLRAKSDLLISAPSIFVCLSVCMVSAPLSLPAKSMKEILLYRRPLCLSTICMIACDRELSAFAPVDPLALKLMPTYRASIIDSTSEHCTSVKFTIFTYCLPSSLQWIACLSFRRSNSFPQYIS